jgi:hypothetical protein
VLLPLIVMQLAPGAGVNWTLGDFIFAIMMFGAVGLAFELATRISTSWWYRGGAALGLAAGFLLIWANLAVGYIGSEDNPYNLLFFGVVAIALAGALLARFRARGMALAMLAAAIAHAAVGLGGVAAEWIGVLREKVVNGLGITCILTTHSPITVALAPEESLFEMVRAEPRNAKVNKREALNRLTVGLPALSVDYSGRRQVFVEADTDAGSYDRLHTLLKADLQLPLSLNFLSTGIKRGKDELGTGCDAVRTIVGKLEEFGNISTFGLVDWDGQARSEGRVHVLAEGVHYAFDNIILHPLLIGLLLLMDGNPPADGLIKFAQAGRGDPAALQAVADAVQSKLDYPEGVAGTVDVQFLNGVAIRTEKAFCLSNGHKMEEALRAAFPKLKRYPLGGGKLINEVIERVLGDMPGFCPMPIVEAFRRLAAS